MKINKKDILHIFENSDDQQEAMIAIYRLVFPGWDDIERIEGGWPKANRRTCIFILGKFIEFDHRKNEIDTMCGVMWFNNGFSIDDELKDWQISLAGVDLVMKS